MTAKHVLIVDDEGDIRELLVLTLMRMGVEAVAARNCEEAYARLNERPFDLCLTDMRLPDGDGLAVLAHIAANYGNTPVAVITAYGSTDDLGFKAAENPAYCYDLHATALHLLGLNHEKLSFYNNGIARRLTDVHGHVIKEIIT